MNSITLLCECCDPQCVARIWVPLDVATRVIRDPHRYLISPDHAASNGDRVIEIHEGYQLVATKESFIRDAI